MRWDSLKNWVGRRDFKRHMGPRKEASKSLQKGEKDSVSKETPEGLLALYRGQQGISWALEVTGVDWVAAAAGPTCHRSQHKLPEPWLAVPVTSRSPERSFFLHPKAERTVFKVKKDRCMNRGLEHVWNRSQGSRYLTVTGRSLH